MTNKNVKKRDELRGRDMNKNEIFLGNEKTKNLHSSLNKLRAIKSLRIGHKSYDITGLPLNPAKYRPLYIHKKDLDLYDKIMTSK